MKPFPLIIILNLILLTSAHSQSVAERVAVNACSHLDSLSSYQQLMDSVERSMIVGMAKIMMDGALEDRKQMGTVEGVRSVLNEAYQILPRHCYNVRKLVIEHKKTEFYRLSDNPLANEHYTTGNAFMESGDFKKAINEFNAAIKLDNNFVYAIDNLAISYRRQDDLKTAIKYYKQSLEIFPEGNVALLNIASAYSLTEDDDNALRYYDEIKFLYPDDPEGYFGAAKILLFKSEYELALNNLFTAHRIYVENDSEYVKDSQKLIDVIFTKLKEINKTDVFEKVAKEHNMKIDFR